MRSRAVSVCVYSWTKPEQRSYAELPVLCQCACTVGQNLSKGLMLRPSNNSDSRETTSLRGLQTWC